MNTPPPENRGLAQRIQSATENVEAEFGIAIFHLESGENLTFNADRSFPMCSVLKIPVLCEAFRQLEAGAFALDDRWTLTHAEKNIGSGILTYMQDGLTPTVRDLLTLMMIVSDNTATDIVVHRLGVENVAGLMRELGLTHIHFVMDIRGIFNAMYGAEWSDPTWWLTDLDRRKSAPPLSRSGTAFSRGPDNDTGTPDNMTRLLGMIYRGEVVSRSACDAMLQIMLQQQLNQRLPRFLPFGIPFAHKTGTLPGVRNDAGILYAGDDSHVAITVFSAWDAETVEGDKEAEWAQTDAIDRAFGQIGLAVFEHYAP